MAQIKADEITQLLREQIANYDSKVQVDEVGTITSLGDGIARLHGLEQGDGRRAAQLPARHCRAGAQPGRGFGRLGDLGRLHRVERGDEVKRTGTILSVPVGEGMIGRVVNALGQPSTTKGR